MWLILITIAIATVYFFFIKRNRDSFPAHLKGETLDGPRAWPFFGNAFDLFIGVPPERFLQQITEWRQQYGTVFKVRFGLEQWVMVSNPQDLETVLSSQTFVEKPVTYDVFKPWLRDSLLTSRGDKWRSRRRALTPSFHFQILDDFMDVFNEQARVLVDKLQRHGCNPINMEPEMSKFTIDVLCETGMGIKLGAQNNDCPYLTATDRLKKISHARMMSPFYNKPFLFQFTQLSKEYRKHIEYIHTITRQWVEQRKQFWAERGGIIKQVDPVTGVKHRMAFLDSLLAAEPPLSDEGIEEETANFAFAGHDTTASSLTFIIYCLSQNLDKQQKLYEEIVGVVGDDPSLPVTPEHINHFKYLEFCFKEALRMYTTVPFVGREVPEDMVIGGKIFPKTATIMCGFYWTAHDPEYFPEPNKFIPERFDVTASADKINPYTYTPFSAGPRNCIGQRFAMYEIKTTIAQLLRNFEILPDKSKPPLKCANAIIMKTVGGAWVKFKPRQN